MNKNEIYIRGKKKMKIEQYFKKYSCVKGNKTTILFILNGLSYCGVWSLEQIKNIKSDFSGNHIFFMDMRNGVMLK